MPKPILSIDRFCSAVKETRRRGYQYRLIETPCTRLTRAPNDLRRFGTVYYESPTRSLWSPLVVVSWVLFDKGTGPWHDEYVARDRLGMSETLWTELRNAIHPYYGYRRPTRKSLLIACGLF